MGLAPSGNREIPGEIVGCPRSAKKQLSGFQVSGKALVAGFLADPEPLASAIPLS